MLSSHQQQKQLRRFLIVCTNKIGFLQDARNLQEQEHINEDDDEFIEDYTPEDVDNSDAGWSTDFAIAILAFCYLLKSSSRNRNTTDSNRRRDIDNPFFYMYLGTFVAHFGGGLAHSAYPNRASDGIGMIGFYITMLIGYV